MSRITSINIVYKNEQPVWSVRKTTHVKDLPAVIGETYGKMCALLETFGEYLNDVPYVAYHNMDMEALDVEIGFPLPRPLAGQDEIQPGTIPASKFVVCMDRGPYDKIEPTYNDVMAWIKEKGYEPTGVFYEYYYNDPRDVSPEDYLTGIMIPIK